MTPLNKAELVKAAPLVWGWTRNKPTFLLIQHCYPLGRSRGWLFISDLDTEWTANRKLPLRLHHAKSVFTWVFSLQITWVVWNLHTENLVWRGLAGNAPGTEQKQTHQLLPRSQGIPTDKVYDSNHTVKNYKTKKETWFWGQQVRNNRQQSETCEDFIYWDS